MVLLLVLAVLSGCSSGGDEVDGEKARRALEQQRIDVRSAAHGVLTALHHGLGGATSRSGGQYRGCESAFNDQFKNFRYLAQARVDVPQPASVGAVGGALRDAGFDEAGTRSIPGGGRSLRFAQGDLTASLTLYPDQTYVLLDLSGPCVDVPEDQRDEWLAKDEPTPDLR
jgi:hypothetical protein